MLLCAEMIRRLPQVIPAAPRKPAHPDMDGARAWARNIALNADAWTRDTAQYATQSYDDLAAVWDEQRSVRSEAEPLRDALARCSPKVRKLCLELGSGTGQLTPLLQADFDQVVSVDLSMQMLRRAEDRSPWRVQADAASLPLPDAVASAAVLVDTLLLPMELRRVLATDGVLIWVNQLGEDSPLYLPTSVVVEALGGGWEGTQSRAGWGTWAVLHRSTVTHL